MVMMVLVVVGMMATTLMASHHGNQQHVIARRSLHSVAGRGGGRAQSVPVDGGRRKSSRPTTSPSRATRGRIHILRRIITHRPIDASVKGTYAIQVIPPVPTDSRIAVKVTGAAESRWTSPRTVSAHIGRPGFSEYVLFVDDQVYIGGPPSPRVVRQDPLEHRHPHRDEQHQ